MLTAKIHLLISIRSAILAVFYTESHCWQFRVISGGGVFGERRIYYSAAAAEQAGRRWVMGG